MSSVRLLVGVTAAAALLSGCTGGPEAAPPSPTPQTTVNITPTPTPTPTPEEQTIRFAVYGPPEQIEAYRDLAQAFMRNNPHLTVKVEASLDPANAFADLQRSFEAGTAADVFLVSQAYLPRLVADERVQPVNHLLDEREVDFGDGYQRDGLVAFSAEAALQCMPHDVTPLVVYYNEDLVRFRSLEDEGEPPTAEDGWSWEQFEAVARDAAAGGVKGVYADAGLRTFAPFLWSAGGELVDDPEQPSTLTLSSDDNQETFTQVLELLRDPDVTPTEEQLARRGAVSRFKRGELAMILGTRALTPELRKAEDLDFDVFPLPSLGRYRTIASMSGYCINAETDVLGAAADFLAFAVSREGATITSLPGYVVPSNLQVQYSPAFLQPGEQPENTFVFAEGVRRTNLLPSVPAWPDVMEATRPLFHRMLHAPVIDLEALLGRIDERSRTVLPQEDTGEE